MKKEFLALFFLFFLQRLLFLLFRRELYQLFSVFNRLFEFFSVALIAIVLLLVSAIFMFVPQSIVVDETRITNALLNAVHFFFSNKKLSAFVIVVSTILLFFVPLVEIAFDQFSFAGRFVSILLVLLFVLPFIEALKTVVYLTKFELIKIHV